MEENGVAAAAAFAALLLGCVVTVLVGGAAAQAPRLPSDYKTLSGCFAKLNSSKTDHDLAYHSAIDDGADVIDCPVQVTSDGVLMCMSSINLLDTTNVQRTPFATPSVVPEIQSTPGIFTFNLTWTNINSSALKRQFLL
ncbi:unnamed protein product [Miscanthus lutarioriparius]|uniref:glycerophosphodiester phosphodiesterase n=1 Tax=Miscanthus lutarioriparius TaxID=422564 RepID=A0A811R3L5_9POAL|nr:unnamed protein product [Miscanthus lutarioriparius]